MTLTMAELSGLGAGPPSRYEQIEAARQAGAKIYDTFRSMSEHGSLPPGVRSPTDLARHMARQDAYKEWQNRQLQSDKEPAKWEADRETRAQAWREEQQERSAARTARREGKREAARQAWQKHQQDLRDARAERQRDLARARAAHAAARAAMTREQREAEARAAYRERIDAARSRSAAAAAQARRDYEAGLTHEGRPVTGGGSSYGIPVITRVPRPTTGPSISSGGVTFMTRTKPLVSVSSGGVTITRPITGGNVTYGATGAAITPGTITRGVVRGAGGGGGGAGTAYMAGPTAPSRTFAGLGGLAGSEARILSGLG